MRIQLLISLTPIIFIAPFAQAYDYPTLDRVDYVLTCMKKNGGQNLDNLYSCSCEIDVIASKLSFDDFVAASTFQNYRNMPGERGSMFRDSESGNTMIKMLTETQSAAKKRCFLVKKPTKSADSKP